jgi:hypothetical protein
VACRGKGDVDAMVGVQRLKVCIETFLHKHPQKVAVYSFIGLW